MVVNLLCFRSSQVWNSAWELRLAYLESSGWHLAASSRAFLLVAVARPLAETEDNASFLQDTSRKCTCTQERTSSVPFRVRLSRCARTSLLHSCRHWPSHLQATLGLNNGF